LDGELIGAWVEKGKHHDLQLWSLVLDNACGVIARHLEAAKVPFIMLKGATIAHWLYRDPGQRTYVDLDVLVPPSAERATIEALRQIGFEPMFDQSSVRSYTPEEQPLRNSQGVEVDLHVALKGVGLPPEEAWAVLREETTPWDWAGTRVPALSVGARALNLALHVTQGGVIDEKAVRDLELGIERLEQSVWREARDLAVRLQACDALSAGLRLLPTGIDLAEALGVAPPTHLRTRMQANAASPSAVQVERIVTLEGWRNRLRLVIRILFPTDEWMRLTYPDRAVGLRGMIGARVIRLGHVVRRILPAVRERRLHRRRLNRDG
jgi:hypothetical protein